MSKGEFTRRSVSEDDVRWMVLLGLPSMPKGDFVGIGDALLRHWYMRCSVVVFDGFHGCQFGHLFLLGYVYMILWIWFFDIYVYGWSKHYPGTFILGIDITLVLVLMWFTLAFGICITCIGIKIFFTYGINLEITMV